MKKGGKRVARTPRASHEHHNQKAVAFVGGALIVLCAGIGGYLIRMYEEAFSYQAPQLLASVTYSGGMIPLEMARDLTAQADIYTNGQIFVTTRGGERLMLRKADGSTIATLRSLIDTSDYTSIFTPKVDGYCPSIVDGIDQKITLYTSNKGSVTFSNCDYEFSFESDLLETINTFVDRDVSTEPEIITAFSGIFGEPITLRAGEIASFPSGVSVTLDAIEDSRCPADVVCVWAGELAAALTVTEGDTSSTIRLGQTTQPQVTSETHTFSLDTITERDATIVVTPVTE